MHNTRVLILQMAKDREIAHYLFHRIIRLLKREWWRTYDAEEIPNLHHVIQSYDTAFLKKGNGGLFCDYYLGYLVSK